MVLDGSVKRGRSRGSTAPSLQYLEKVRAAGPEAQTAGFLDAETGFLPPRPLARLPESHEEWELVAAELPAMCVSRDYGMVFRMSQLSAEPEDLKDTCLLRANALLGAMAHATKNLSLTPVEIPPCVMIPWKRVGERLGRPTASFTWLDHVVYNYEYVDQRVEKGDFVVTNPWVQLKPYLLACGGMGEANYIIAAQGIERANMRLPGMVARAQQAVLSNDHEALRVELRDIMHALERMTMAFVGSDPRHTSASYMDHVTWATVTGRLGSGVVKGEKTISGLLFPSIHLMDAFLGRDKERDYKSDMGTLARADVKWLPTMHQEFLQAVRKVSLRDFVRSADGNEFLNMYRTIHHRFVGPEGSFGFLEYHRLKINSYIECSVKTRPKDSRSGALPKAEGEALALGWQTRPWYMVNGLLTASMAERDMTVEGVRNYTDLEIKSVEELSGSEAKVVRLSVKGTGLLYQPGDRLAVLPTNDEDLVDETLDVLREDGTRLIPLTEQWLQAAEDRRVATVLLDGARCMPLHEFLKHATLHPMTRAMAQAAREATLNTSSRVDANMHRVAETDFATFVSLLAGTCVVNVRSKLVPILASILPPLRQREYSIASAPQPPTSPEEVTIVVGRVRHGVTGLAWLLEDAPGQGAPRTASGLRTGVSTLVAGVSTLGLGGGSSGGGDGDSDVDLAPSSPPLSRYLKSEASSMVGPRNLDAPQRALLQKCLSALIGSASTRSDEQKRWRRWQRWWGEWARVVNSMLAEPQGEDEELAARRRWPRVKTSDGGATASGLDGPGLGGGSGDLAGVASHMLLDTLKPGQRVPVAMSPAPFFRLPQDPAAPVVLVSMGTGVAPFMGFLQDIAAVAKDTGTRRKVWLVWGVQNKGKLHFEDAWLPHVKSGLVTPMVAFSREDVDMVVDPPAPSSGGEEQERAVRFVDGKRKRIGALFDPEDKKGRQNLRDLWGLLERGGHVYVCGRPELTEVVRKITSDAFELCSYPLFNVSWYYLKSKLRELAAAFTARLVADNRVSFDLFNSGKPPQTDEKYNWSEIARHHTEDDCWVVFRGGVYDITEYLMVHPGGLKILLDKGGRDMTEGFDVAHGASNFRVASILDGYFIGMVKHVRHVYPPGFRANEWALKLLHMLLEHRSVWHLNLENKLKGDEPMGHIRLGALPPYRAELYNSFCTYYAGLTLNMIEKMLTVDVAKAVHGLEVKASFDAAAVKKELVEACDLSVLVGKAVSLDEPIPVERVAHGIDVVTQMYDDLVQVAIDTMASVERAPTDPATRALAGAQQYLHLVLPTLGRVKVAFRAMAEKFGVAGAVC